MPDLGFFHRGQRVGAVKVGLNRGAPRLFAARRGHPERDYSAHRAREWQHSVVPSANPLCLALGARADGRPRRQAKLSFSASLNA